MLCSGFEVTLVHTPSGEVVVSVVGGNGSVDNVPGREVVFRKEFGKVAFCTGCGCDVS